MSATLLSRVLPVPVGDEVVELSLDDLPVDIEDYVQVLREERSAGHFWMKLASECGARKRLQDCEMVLQSAIQTLSMDPRQGYRPSQASAEECAPFHAMLSTLYLARARPNPKVILPEAKFQNLTTNATIEPKERQQQAAASHAQSAAVGAVPPMMKGRATLRHGVLLGRGIFLTVTGRTDEALKAFDDVLRFQARNPAALMGKACCLLRKRAYANALKIYQEVLAISLAQNARAAQEAATAAAADGDAAHNPASKWLGPDPRVGIGLCLHGLGKLAEARRAWARAIAVDPKNPSPHLLLGLSKLNAAKQLARLPRDLMRGGVTEVQARAAVYKEGLAHVEASWKLDNKVAMTAIALAEHITARAVATAATNREAAQKEFGRALKLGEHAIQYADSKAAVLQAWLVFARTAHLCSYSSQASSGAVADEIELRSLAQRYYGRVIEDYSRGPPGGGAGPSADASNSLAPAHALAALGLAQLQVARGEALGAKNTLEGILSRPASTSSSCIELSLLSAAVRAQSHPGATAAEKQADQDRARILLDRTLRSVEAARAETRGARPSDDLDVVIQTLALADKADQAINGSDDSLAPGLAIARTALGTEKLGKLALKELALLGDDVLAHVQMADLVRAGGPQDLSRAVSSYVTALRTLRVKQLDLGGEELALKKGQELAEAEQLAVRLRANLGALLGLRGMEEHSPQASLRCLTLAVSQLQEALSGAGRATTSASLDAEKTVTLYNLGRVLELTGAFDDARKAYDAVLTNHPEYVHAKTRQALLLASQEASRGVKAATQMANTLFKEALNSDPADIDTRSTYICFLAGELPGSPVPPQWDGIKETIAQLFIGPNSPQAASLFGGATAARAVSDEARHDPYTLASLGWTYYNIAHSLKPGPNQRKERTRALLRAVDLMDKALAADSRCAFAAQGLAILSAEGSLLDLGLPPNTTLSSLPDADVRRKKGADDAINLLGKLREVRADGDDGSVNICMGHAFMVKEDYERALKSYELAHRRHLSSQQDNNKEEAAEGKPSILQYMARAEYWLGQRTKSYKTTAHSLVYLQEALDVLQKRASEAGGSAGAAGGMLQEIKYVRYNMAVTRQKVLQMLFDASIESRSLEDLQSAVSQLDEAQRTFGELVDDARAGQLSYITAEIVEQRQMYGETSLVRGAERHVQEQAEYEERTKAERDAVAARKRERAEKEEKERAEREERDKEERERIKEERKKALEAARAWEYLREDMLAETEKKKRSSGGGGGGGGRRGGKKGAGRKKKTEEGGSEIETSDSERDVGGPLDEEEDDPNIVSDHSSQEGDGGLTESEEEAVASGAESEGEEGEDAAARRARKLKKLSDKKRRKEEKKDRKRKKKERRESGGGGEKRKKKKKKPSTDAAGSDDEEEGESRPSKKQKKQKTKRPTKEDDLIDSDEEIL
ncbi:hypothetical protein FA10DRAFT_268777 [Acaromyces ingoldii]|uniref:TPR-like protein n=1 Tax=Acaromyces ingoldii TaxID=215250 RepID=A0A316YHC5_9BASI|nr:hypothetical protein FA10DRAFT_268777 [Acaromyces ingoldii]PWN88599.1 hypothetical protein FA10DRAFT_268777 [Acaromyces ingoldii]